MLTTNLPDCAGFRHAPRAFVNMAEHAKCVGEHTDICELALGVGLAIGPEKGVGCQVFEVGVVAVAFMAGAVDMAGDVQNPFA